MIEFNERKHEYTFKGERFISATQLISRYVPLFDTEYWSLYKAIKEVFEAKNQFRELKKLAGHWTKVVKMWNDDISGRTPNPKKWPECHVPAVEKGQKKFKKMWKDKNTTALAHGTKVHNTMEFVTKEMKGFMREGIIVPLGDHHPMQRMVRGKRSYAEIRLFNLEFMTAGTADIAMFDNSVFDIEDYKTNEEIETEGFMGATLLPPLDELPNCNFSEYTIQLSLYAWMLEECGYECKKLRLLHLGEESSLVDSSTVLPYKVSEEYEVPYRKDLVIKMLNDYRDGSNQ